MNIAHATIAKCFGMCGEITIKLAIMHTVIKPIVTPCLAKISAYIQASIHQVRCRKFCDKTQRRKI
jgi:hypothetical protein